MAAPASTDIEALYSIAEQAGVTRDEVDAIAKPMIRRIGSVSGFTDVRSNAELRAITTAVHAEIDRRLAVAGRGPIATGEPATTRQIDYIAALGGDPAVAATMTRHEVSALIDSLKRPGAPAGGTA